MPGTDCAPGKSFVGGGDLAVFSDAGNEDGAWKFIQWLAEPETQQAFYDEVGDLPAVQSAWDSGELADDPQLQVFGRSSSRRRRRPSRRGKRSPADGQHIEKATKGQVSAEEAVKTMQQKAASIGTGL